jgi:hypothetical protein
MNNSPRGGGIHPSTIKQRLQNTCKRIGFVTELVEPWSISNLPENVQVLVYELCIILDPSVTVLPVNDSFSN